MPYPMMGSSQSHWNNVPDFVGIGAAKVREDTASDALGAEASNSRPREAPPARRPRRTQTLSDRERELNYALVAAHRNLTRMSQYMLKLEARAKIATQEETRLTIEATLENQQHSSRADTDDDGDYHAQLIEDVTRLSDQVWNRMFLVDKSFTRTSRQHRKENGHSGPIPLLGESHTKHWLDREAERTASGLLHEETFFYTVRDLAAGRPLTEWLEYIRDWLHRIQGDDGLVGVREDRVVAIAWAFLDRAIRPPARPRVSTTVHEFIAEWDSLRRSGAFDGALEEPESQMEVDAEVLESLRPIWSARHKPL